MAAEPSADARAHSEQLSALIRGEIGANGGAIPFSRFMELALYAPGLGYYSASSMTRGSWRSAAAAVRSPRSR